MPVRQDEYFDQGEAMPLDQLVDARQRAIGELLNYAYSRLPFYRELWDRHGFAPDGVNGAAALENVPIVRKRDLVRAAMEAGSMTIGIEAFDGREPSNVVMTSGTMGFNTFAALTDYDLTGASILAQARELWMMRLRAGMRVLSLSPAWHALGLFESQAITRIGAVPILPWGTLTARFSADILNAVMSLRPEHVLVTARAMRMLLSRCELLRLDPRRAFASVRYLGCAGEALSPAFRAHLVERLELEDVFERGGSSDGMFGGAECHCHRGHHISADAHYVEIVDPCTGAPAPDGQRGTAVVTNLSLGKSLYIRFDTEDVAEIVPGDCPCGRTHPVVEFYGRLADSVVLADRIVTPADVRAVLDEFACTRFRPFAMRWTQSDGLVLYVDQAGRADAAERTALESACAARLALPVSIAAGEVAQATWKEERIGRNAER